MPMFIQIKPTDGKLAGDKNSSKVLVDSSANVGVKLMEKCCLWWRKKKRQQDRKKYQLFKKRVYHLTEGIQEDFSNWFAAGMKI